MESSWFDIRMSLQEDSYKIGDIKIMLFKTKRNRMETTMELQF